MLCSYSVGYPEFTTVTITSAESTTVSLASVDSSLDESGNNPGSVRLQRTSGVGDITVTLDFTGTASFGADYQIQVDGTVLNTGEVTLADGVTSVLLDIVPIPDSRSEMPGESVTLTIQPLTIQPGGSYFVGAPSTMTVNITDDDPVSLPASGYKLTDLGNGPGNAPSYAFGINTEPDGLGGFRGQVVGMTSFLTNGVGPQVGFRWNNGSFSHFYIPPTPSYYINSAALAINDVATTVGYRSWYYNNTYYGNACYWPVGAGSPTLLAGLNSGTGLDNLASDINQRDSVNGLGGLIAGQSVRTDGRTHAVVWIPNSAGVYAAPMDIGDLGNGARYSYSAAINDYGMVVGRSQIGTGNNYHGFRTKNMNNGGQWEPIPLFPDDDDMGTATGTDAHTSEFNDINKYQEIVGRGNAPSGQMRALYKTPYSPKDAGYRDLGVLGAGTANAGTESVAHAISANGIIVGSSKVLEGSSQVWRAFVLNNTGTPGSVPMTDLTGVSSVYQGGQWLSVSSQGWKLVSAERVNRAGWIVGYGTKGGVTRAFVLSPR